MKKAALKKHLAVKVEPIGIRTACGHRYLDPARVTWDRAEYDCKTCGRGRWPEPKE